jgi:hypothetical protein
MKFVISTIVSITAALGMVLGLELIVRPDLSPPRTHLVSPLSGRSVPQYDRDFATPPIGYMRNLVLRTRYRDKKAAMHLIEMYANDLVAHADSSELFRERARDAVWNLANTNTEVRTKIEKYCSHNQVNEWHHLCWPVFDLVTTCSFPFVMPRQPISATRSDLVNWATFKVSFRSIAQSFAQIVPRPPRLKFIYIYKRLSGMRRGRITM